MEENKIYYIKFKDELNWEKVKFIKKDRGFFVFKKPFVSDIIIAKPNSIKIKEEK